MISLTCPTCSVALKPKLELAGKNIKCPKCETLVRVPESTQASPQSNDEVANPWPLRIGVTAAVVVALAVGATGGFIYGHGKGMADRERDAIEAKAKGEDAERRAIKVATDLDTAVAERGSVVEKLDATIKERDEARKAVKDRDDKWAARDKADAERAQVAAQEKERQLQEQVRRREEEAKERAQKETQKTAAARERRASWSKQAAEHMRQFISYLPAEEKDNYDSVLVFLLLKMNEKKEGKLTVDGAKEILNWRPGLRRALRDWVEIGGDIRVGHSADVPSIAETVEEMSKLLKRDLTK